MEKQSRNKINSDYSSLAVCGTCKEEKIIAEYYWTNNKIYNKEGYFPICKNCLSKRYENLIEMYDDYIMALLHLCLNFDFPFDWDLAKSIITKNDPVLTLPNYIDGVIKKCGRKGAFSNKKNTVDSIKEYINKNGVLSLGINEDIEKFKVTKDMLRRWGENYSKSDLYFLENQYNELVETYSGNSPTEKNLYADYALNELAKRKARDAGEQKVVNDITKIQQSIMNDAKLKPTQDNSSQSDEILVGKFIQKITENAPIDESDPKYDDVDGIREIIQKEYISPLLKSAGVMK